MFTKPEIYNLALGHLLLRRQIIDPTTDKSNECLVLNTHFPMALRLTLEDLDLDSLSNQVDLEFLANRPNEFWLYAYKYPADCAKLRRIKSLMRTDNRLSHVDRAVRQFNGQTAILTNQHAAVAEYISTNVPITSFSAPAAMALSVRLAQLSTPLIVGKGAQKLRVELNETYKIYKGEAQEKDQDENANYEPDDVTSEWVAERLS